MTVEEMRLRKKELGLTNEEIAGMSGVPLGTVQKVFAGITEHPRRGTLTALEKIFTPEAPSQGLPATAYGDVQSAGKSPIREETAAYSTEKSRGYTIEDYYSLPDERRAELIDGRFYDMGSPSSIHQLLSSEIFRVVSNYICSEGGTCVPFYSPMDVQLDCDDKTLLQPDVMVVCDRSRIGGRCIFGAPDWVIEILSPSTRKKDMIIKSSKYEQAGVREYWMVDPDKKQVIVYFFDAEDFSGLSLYGFDDKVPVGIWNGRFSVDFAEIYDYAGFLYE